MINIEVEVKVNGNPVQVSGKLNDLVAWFITQKLVSDDISNSGAVANFAGVSKNKEVKSRHGSRHGGARTKKPWNSENEQLLIDTVRQFTQNGRTFSDAAGEVAGKLDRSVSGVWTKIIRLRQVGRL